MQIDLILNEMKTIDSSVIYDSINEVFIVLNNKNIFSIVNLLKNKLDFHILIDLFGVHFMNRDICFDLVYNFLNLKHNLRLKIKFFTKDTIDSIVSIFPSANWLERETFDMFGIIFNNHPNLKRILTDYGFIGNPLRKDFPLYGDFEVTYDEDLQKVIYKKIELKQQFRNFDTTSKWFNLPK